jgi:hypothetical protein
MDSRFRRNDKIALTLYFDFTVINMPLLPGGILWIPAFAGMTSGCYRTIKAGKINLVLH